MLYGLHALAKDDITADAHWQFAVEQYKTVAPNHTETVLSIEATGWFRRTPATKLDRAVQFRLTRASAPAATNPSVPEDLRKRATALSGK